MGRSSNAVKAERINLAQKFLHESQELSEAAVAMVQLLSISKRQAYRYLREAQEYERPVPIPAQKIAFTVKLPQPLVEALHERAHKRKQPLSELVTQALETFISRPGGRSG